MPQTLYTVLGSGSFWVAYLVKICVENSNSNEVQFDETTFILLSIAKSNITLRGYKLQTCPQKCQHGYFLLLENNESNI